MNFHRYFYVVVSPLIYDSQMILRAKLPKLLSNLCQTSQNIPCATKQPQFISPQESKKPVIYTAHNKILTEIALSYHAASMGTNRHSISLSVA